MTKNCAVTKIPYVIEPPLFPFLNPLEACKTRIKKAMNKKWVEALVKLDY